MRFWLDALLSPVLATWISTRFNVECRAIRDLNLRDADDKLIFATARKENAVVITKDRDFGGSYDAEKLMGVHWRGGVCPRRLQQ